MKTAKIILSLMVIVLSLNITNAQVSINTDGTDPDASAMLDVKSIEKGFLPPRMTKAQRDAITPVEGLIVYNLSTKRPNYYNGTEWVNFDGTSAQSEIGDSYQGGVIAYILQSGDPGYVEGEVHGLIAAVEDQNEGIAWITGGSTQTTENGNTSTFIGTGPANTYYMLPNINNESNE